MTSSSWQATLTAWLAEVRTDVGRRLDPHIDEAAADVVETLFTRPDALAAAMHRTGQRLGDEGWPLQRVHRWLHHLTLIVGRRHRVLLRSQAATASLAEGWAAGMVRGAGEDVVTDAVTGLSTPYALRLRLHELFEQARGTGRAPSDTHSFVVIDAPVGGAGPFRNDIVIADVARTVDDVFRRGEVVARSGGRIVVLTERSPSTEARAIVLHDRLRLSSVVEVRQTMVWVDSLPPTVGHIDTLLRELAG